MACFASDLVLGAVLLGVGAVGVRYPRKAAKLGEVIDAVGSQRRADEVEPAGWNVRYTLATFVLMAFVGAMLLFAALARC